MSILIRNKIIPHRCQTCFCCESFFYGTEILCKICQLLGEDVTEYRRFRNPNCPLIEVPDTYEIKTRSLTDEERKSYLEALKKGSVKTGNRLYLTDEGGE